VAGESAELWKMQLFLDPDTPVIDRTALDVIAEVFSSSDPDALLDLLETFLTESAKQIEEMHSAFLTGDWATLHRMAHSLKSSSATFGATRLAQVSAALELAAKEPVFDERHLDLIGQVRHEHLMACEGLRLELARLTGA
jgi:HPt (histidine-containing phosphotransfer) domain-containing protein